MVTTSISAVIIHRLLHGGCLVAATIVLDAIALHNIAVHWKGVIVGVDIRSIAPGGATVVLLIKPKGHVGIADQYFAGECLKIKK